MSHDKAKDTKIKMTIKRFLWTLLSSLVFGWIGLVSINYLKNPFLYFFLIGVSIPIANWRWVKFNRALSVCALGVLSVLLCSLFVVLTVLMGQLAQHINFLWTGIGQLLPYIGVGFVSMGFMYLHTLFISIFRMQWAISFLMVMLSTSQVLIMVELFERLGRTESDFILMTWFLITTVIICLSSNDYQLRKPNKSS